jgi:hypothetical protein
MASTSTPTPSRTANGDHHLLPCPYDVDGIDACPGNRPVSPVMQHRSRVTCRYFQVRVTEQGPVGTCTRPPD